MRTPEWTWRQLHLPRPLEPNAMAALLEHLASDASFGPLAFEARASGGQVNYYVANAEPATKRLTRAMTSALPGTHLTKAAAGRPTIDAALLLKPTRPDLAIEVRSVEATVRATLTALETAQDNETLVLQIALDRRIPPSMPVSGVDEYPNLLAALWGAPRKPSAQEGLLRRAKRATHGFEARIRIGAASEAKGPHRPSYGAWSGPFAPSSRPAPACSYATNHPPVCRARR